MRGKAEPMSWVRANMAAVAGARGEPHRCWRDGVCQMTYGLVAHGEGCRAHLHCNEKLAEGLRDKI